MDTHKKTSNDDRQWNGLAYVHNSPVSGCHCGSCSGYFTRIISESSAFRMGYRFGKAAGYFKTPREVSQQFPHWPNGHVDAYLSGLDDGVRGDSYRYSMLLTNENEQYQPDQNV